MWKFQALFFDFEGMEGLLSLCVFEDPSFGLLFRSAAERYFGISEQIENEILRELYTPILNPRVKGKEFEKRVHLC
jgi:hypothetical protein